MKIRKIFLLIFIQVFILSLWFVPSLYSKDFIYHGDFAFKTDFFNYLDSVRYVWNEVNGSLSLDNNIRFFSRLPFLLFYALFQSNILFSYFFILFNIAAFYAGGFIFLHHILKLSSKHSLLLAVLFVINPVFLGNFSKLGLVYGVMLLPFILYFIKQYFKRGLFAWLVLAVMFLNFSFVHPFTFFVNALLASLIFFITFYVSDRKRVVVIFDIVKSLVVVLLINAYYLLPLTQIQSLQKSEISRSTGVSGEEQSLLGIANTKNLAESISFSKSVFVEYRFFLEDGHLMIYLFYLLLFLLIFYGYQKYSRYFTFGDKRLGFLFIALLLISFFLVGGSCFDFMVEVYHFLYSLPAGWAFRSPLKWQLYQPFLFVGCIAFLVKYNQIFTKKFRYVLSIFLLLLVVTNIVTVYDIFKNLILPQNYTFNFNHYELRDKKILLQNNIPCRKEINEERAYFDELKHLFINTGASYKTLNNPDLYNNTLYFSNFDFVLTCEKPNSEILEYFSIFYARTEPSYYLLKNRSGDRDTLQIQEGVIGVTQFLDYEDFDFLEQGQLFGVGEDIGADVIDVFRSEYISEKEIDVRDYKHTIDSAKNIELIYELQGNQLEIFYRHNGVLVIGGETVFNNNKVLAISTKKLTKQEVHINGERYPLLEGSHSLGNYNLEKLLVKYEESENIIEQDISSDEYTLDGLDVKNKSIKLITNRYTPNLIQNPSFEEGMWHPEVHDCYNYDDYPNIVMALSDKHVTHGQKSLTLSSVRHTACAIQEFAVSPNYALDFALDADGVQGVLDYSIVFNNENHTAHTFRQDIDGPVSVSEHITVPKDATSARLFLKAPQLDLFTSNKIYIDNISIYEKPERNHMYYYANIPDYGIGEIIEYTRINPTEYNLSIKSNKDTIIVLEQDFNEEWALLAEGEEVGNHFRYNYLYNAWYLNVAELCNTLDHYEVDEEGYYYIDLELHFRPQVQYDIGLKISWISFVLLISYCLYVFILDSRKKSFRVKK